MSQLTQEISKEKMPVPPEVIDFHNKFFLTNLVNDWTLENFHQYCVSDVHFADYHLCDDEGDNRVRHGFKCGVQKVLKKAPPFEKLNLTPQEYMVLGHFLGKELHTKTLKRQKIKTSVPGKIIHNGDNFNESAINIKGNLNKPTTIADTTYTLTPAQLDALSRSLSPSPAGGIELARPGKRKFTVNDELDSVQPLPADDRIPDPIEDYAENLSSGPASQLDDIFSDETPTIPPALVSASDIILPSKESLIQKITDFIASDAAKAIDETTRTANIAKSAHGKDHDKCLLRIRLGQLKKRVIFLRGRFHRKLLDKFLTAADVDALQQLLPETSQPTRDEAALFARMKASMTEELRSSGIAWPEKQSLVRAWCFINAAFTFATIEIPILSLHTINNRAEGWWDQTVWSKLIYGALSSSSVFEYNSKELVSVVDEDQLDMAKLTPRKPRPRASTSAAAPSRPDPATPTPSTQSAGPIKYDGLVRKPTARGLEPFDIAFIEVKSERNNASPYTDRLKVLRAMRRALLIIRSRLFERLEKMEEVDEAMAGVVVVGILCNGPRVSFLYGCNPKGALVLMDEEQHDAFKDACAVAETAWRTRRALEATCEVLSRDLGSDC